MNNWKFSVSLRLLTILVCLESINYIAFAQELISKQPSNCGSTNYYDGRLFGCAVRYFSKYYRGGKNLFFKIGSKWELC